MVDIPTFIAYSVALFAMIGGLFLFFWLREGRPGNLIWFSLPFLAGACGGAVLVDQSPGFGIWQLRLGAWFILLAYGFGWQAVRALYGRPFLASIAIGPTLLWLALSATIFEAWSLHAVSASMRALLVALYNGLAARELWRSRDERLPARSVLFWIFVVYAAGAAVRIPFSAILPAPLGAAPTAAWAVVLYNFSAVTEALVVSAFIIALSRERIAMTNFRLAHRDPLTGAHNRRAYEERLKSLDSGLGAGSSGIALLLFDIDQFKAVNDRFGHEAGDKVIILAAKAAENSLQDGAGIFRIGGEEFACLLPGVTGNDALEAAERVRTTFQMMAKVVEGDAVDATISIGVAISNDPSRPVSELLSEADRALYEAKRSGRNRTVLLAGGPGRDGRCPAQTSQ